MRGARMARGGCGPWRGHRRRPVAAGSRRGGPRRPVGPAREDEAGGWPVARRVWGGPWRAPRGGVARGAACIGVPCGSAPGAGAAGGPSVHPVGPWPAHDPWRRAPHPPRRTPPGGGPRLPGRMRPGARARLTRRCSRHRWRGSWAGRDSCSCRVPSSAALHTPASGAANRHVSRVPQRQWMADGRPTARGARIGMQGGRMMGGVPRPWCRHRRRPVAAGSRRGGPRRPISPAREDAAGA